MQKTAQLLLGVLAQYDEDIWTVCTLQEAAKLWLRDPDSIMYHITEDHLIARKASGTWLISRASLIVLFGVPPKAKIPENSEKIPEILPNSKTSSDLS